jgi:ABC-2 type transport system permease protein
MISGIQLLRLSLRRVRLLLLGMGGLLWVVQLLLVLVARSLEVSGDFEHLAALLPPFVRTLLGPSVLSVMSFKGIACVGYFDLGILLALLALTVALATLHASEVDSGFADLILSRPFARHWIISRTVALLVISVTLMLAAMVTGTWAGLELFARANMDWPSPRVIGALALNLASLLICWGGLATALAAIFRRAVASAVMGLLILGMLLADLLAGLSAKAKWVGWLSPFHYFAPFDLVMGRELHLFSIAMLWAVAIIGFISAYILFSRRDIRR